MFDSLSDRLNDVFDRLRRRGALGEDDVAAVLREFVAAVREKAVGQEVLRSVTPGQMVVKIVHDHLVEVLGGSEPRGRGASSDSGLDLNAPPPVVIMLVGL